MPTNIKTEQTPGLISAKLEIIDAKTFVLRTTNLKTVGKKVDINW